MNSLNKAAAPANAGAARLAGWPGSRVTAQVANAKNPLLYADQTFVQQQLLL